MIESVLDKIIMTIVFLGTLFIGYMIGKADRKNIHYHYYDKKD